MEVQTTDTWLVVPQSDLKRRSTTIFSRSPCLRNVVRTSSKWQKTKTPTRHHTRPCHQYHPSSDHTCSVTNATARRWRILPFWQVRRCRDGPALGRRLPARRRWLRLPRYQPGQLHLRRGRHPRRHRRRRLGRRATGWSPPPRRRMERHRRRHRRGRGRGWACPANAALLLPPLPGCETRRSTITIFLFLHLDQSSGPTTPTTDQDVSETGGEKGVVRARVRRCGIYYHEGERRR